MKYFLLFLSITVFSLFSSIESTIAEQNSTPAFVPDTVLVKFKPGSAKNKKNEGVESVNGTTEKVYQIVPGLQKITTNLGVEKAIEILSKNPNVEFAEPDFIVTINITPNDTYYYLQWGEHNTGQIVNGQPGTPYVDINAPEAWDTDTGDPNLVIANIDILV